RSVGDAQDDPAHPGAKVDADDFPRCGAVRQACDPGSAAGDVDAHVVPRVYRRRRPDRAAGGSVELAEAGVADDEDVRAADGEVDLRAAGGRGRNENEREEHDDAAHDGTTRAAGPRVRKTKSPGSGLFAGKMGGV